MNMPEWWIGVSGVFFILGILLFLVLIVAIFVLIGMVKSLQSKLDTTIKKVEDIATRVDGLTKTAQTTVDRLGGSARNVASNVESVVVSSARKIESLSGIFLMAMTGIKLYQAMKGAKKSKDEDDED